MTVSRCARRYQRGCSAALVAVRDQPAPPGAELPPTEQRLGDIEHKRRDLRAELLRELRRFG